MKTYIYFLLFILLLLFTSVIIPIKCGSEKNTWPSEFYNISDSCPSTSYFSRRRSLNPNANEYNPFEDNSARRHSRPSFDELSFKQLFSQIIAPTECFDLNTNYFPTISQTTSLDVITSPIHTENPLNEPKKEFIVDFNPELIIKEISKHFDEFGWPEDEKFVTDNKNYLISYNLLSGNANWILEIVSPENIESEKEYRDFGHYGNKNMLKTVELLDSYASCVSKKNKKNIITITGPISVISDSLPQKTNLKGRVKNYQFDKQIKHPPITQFFKVIIIKYLNKNYCFDIIFTEANWDINTDFDDISKEFCGKNDLQNWNFKNYIKDNKVMEELFNNKLEFLEWYIGFELIDLIHYAGFKEITELENCSNFQLFEASHLMNRRNKSISLKSLVIPTFSNKFENIDLSDINIERNKNKYSKSNIRIYQDFIVNFNRRKRIPNWVLEYFTKENLYKLSHGRLKWLSDPDFSQIFQPKYNDYDYQQRSEFGHGHLATGYLHPHKQGFYLTNSVPQLNKVNGGHWRVVEEYISCLAKKAEETFIYTGPLFLPIEETDLMEFQVLGPKEIFIPTNLFKIVILKIYDNNNWKYWLESYVMTNTNVDKLFDVGNEKTNPKDSNGSPKIVHECRNEKYLHEYEKGSPSFIVDLLKYYRKPYKFIEEYSEFRLFKSLSEKIKEIKDGVLFDMEIEIKDDNLNKNLKEKEIFDTFGGLNKEKISELLPKDSLENIFNLNQHKTNKNEEKKKKGEKSKLPPKYEESKNEDLYNKREEIIQNIDDISEKSLSEKNIKTNEWQRLNKGSKKKKDRKQIDDPNISNEKISNTEENIDKEIGKLRIDMVEIDLLENQKISNKTKYAVSISEDKLV